MQETIRLPLITVSTLNDFGSEILETHHNISFSIVLNINKIGRSKTIPPGMLRQRMNNLDIP